MGRARFFLLALSLLLSASSFAAAKEPPADAEMIARFEENKPQFSELRDIAMEDGIFELALKDLEAASVKNPPGTPHRDLSKLSAGRRSQYMSLFIKLNIRRVRSSDAGVQIVAAASDLHGWSKSYVWARNLEGVKVFPSLDYPLDREGLVEGNPPYYFQGFRQIEDGWYLELQGPDLPTKAPPPIAGNLQATRDVGCISLAEVQNDYTPADIFIGLGKCLLGGRYDRAADLYWIMGAYGIFDTERVADKTAHQAMAVFRQGLFESLTEAQRVGFQKALDARKTNNAGICGEIKRIGPPAYHPNYMINHGMGAIIAALDARKRTEPLIRDFDAAKAWTKTLEVLKCT